MPSGDETSLTAAFPIFTVLPVFVKPLPFTLMVSPGRTPALGYSSEIETKLGFGAVTVSSTVLLRTMLPTI
jgi:hypothetical protein